MNRHYQPKAVMDHGLEPHLPLQDANSQLQVGSGSGLRGARAWFPHAFLAAPFVPSLSLAAKGTSAKGTGYAGAPVITWYFFAWPFHAWAVCMYTSGDDTGRQARVHRYLTSLHCTYSIVGRHPCALCTLAPWHPGTLADHARGTRDPPSVDLLHPVRNTCRQPKRLCSG